MYNTSYFAIAPNVAPSLSLSLSLTVFTNFGLVFFPYRFEEATSDMKYIYIYMYMIYVYGSAR